MEESCSAMLNDRLGHKGSNAYLSLTENPHAGNGLPESSRSTILYSLETAHK